MEVAVPSDACEGLLSDERGDSDSTGLHLKMAAIWVILASILGTLEVQVDHIGVHIPVEGILVKWRFWKLWVLSQSYRWGAKATHRPVPQNGADVPTSICHVGHCRFTNLMLRYEGLRYLWYGYCGDEGP